jgi:hypothetical protein
LRGTPRDAGASSLAVVCERRSRRPLPAQSNTEVDSLKLIGAERHAILHARGGGALARELEDGIYNVFAIEHGRIARIDDYADREPALRAAGLT